MRKELAIARRGHVMLGQQLKHLGKHSAIYGLSNVVAASAGLVLLPLLTRFLAPAQYGTLELLTVLVAQLGVLLQLGLGAALFRFELHDQGGRERGVAVSTAFYTIVAVSLVAVAVLLPLAPALARLVLGDASHAALLRWVLVKLLFDAASVIPMARLRMHEASGTYALLSSGRLALSLLLIFVALTVFDAGLPGVVVAMTVESAIFALTVATTAASDLKPRFSKAALRGMLAFGIPLIPFAFALTLLALGDRYLLRLFGNVDQIGRYAVGYKIAAALAVPIRAFQVAWPRTLFAVSETPSSGAFYSKLLTYFLVLIGFCGVVVSLFAGELIQLLAGGAYAGAAAVVPILVLGQISLGAFYVTAVGTNLSGKTYFQTFAAAIALVVLAVSGFVLVPAWGMVGAACATALGYVTLAAANCAFSVRLYPVRYEWRRIATLLLITLALIAVGTVLESGSRLLDVAIKLVLVGAYPVLLYASGVLSAVDRAAVRLTILRLLARVLLPNPAASFDVASTKRVLIFGGMGIGNLVMFTPTMRALRAHMPRARITLLTVGNGANNVVEGSDIVDEVTVVPPGIVARLKLALRLRRRGYDLLVAPFQGEDFKLVTLLSGIPHRVGHVTSPGWVGRADFLYNVPVRMLEDEHEVDRKLRLAQALGLDPTTVEPLFHIDDADRAAARTFLVANGVTATDRLVGVPIDVSRMQDWKRWHPDRLAAVCNELSSRGGLRIVLMGSADSVDDLARFRKMLEFEPVVALGKTTLKQTAAIVEACDLTICVDSGLMHVSAAVGTPVLAIYGPTDHRRTSPLRYGGAHRVVRQPVECGPCFRMEGDTTVRTCSHRKCLSLVTTAEVVRVADEMLGLRRSHRDLAVFEEQLHP